MLPQQQKRPVANDRPESGNQSDTARKAFQEWDQKAMVR